MIQIKAKFIGTDSLGYVNNQIYDLKIDTKKSNQIQRLDGTGKCLYASISTFLRNWKIIDENSIENVIGVDVFHKKCKELNIKVDMLSPEGITLTFPDNRVVNVALNTLTKLYGSLSFAHFTPSNACGEIIKFLSDEYDHLKKLKQ